MAGKNHIWYVGYGSNVDEQRFLCYIRGGKPDGNSKEYSGARNKSIPLLNESVVLDHELYFAKHSNNWNGAVSFIRNTANSNVETYARRYLITKEQFEDVAKQETGMVVPPVIDFNQAINQLYTVFKTPSWYGKVLFLGITAGHPVFTLTNETDLKDYGKPSESYLKTIGNGIKTFFNTDNITLSDYFITKKGIIGNYTKEQLNKIFNL